LARLDEQRSIVDHGMTGARVGALVAAMEAEEGPHIGTVNAALRVLFEGVTVDYLTGCLRFLWRQGGQTELLYAWVD
jgi:hypothetical protein